MFWLSRQRKCKCNVEVHFKMCKHVKFLQIQSLTCCYHCVVGGGVDYDSGSYTATFPAGVTRVSFNVSINDDNIFEHSETLTLIIDASFLPSRVMAVPMCHLSVTIVDNDCKLSEMLCYMYNIIM